MAVPTLSKKERETCEFYLSNGILCAQVFEGEKVEQPSDLTLKIYIAQNPERLRELLRAKGFGETVRQRIEESMARYSLLKQEQNEKLPRAEQHPLYRVQHDSHFQGGMEFDPKTIPQSLPGSKKKS
jgi:hypothetical protein